MLFPGPMTAFNFTYDNWGTSPATTIGTSVSTAAFGLLGSWTEIASSASLSQDCYWLYLRVHTAAVSGAVADALIDLGIDPAGGTSYTSFFETFNVGGAPSLTQVGSREHLFPIFIKAGSSVAVRIQGGGGGTLTARVAARFYGQPTNPLACPVGAFSEKFGTTTGFKGQSFTPGNASDGSWANLGSVTKPLWWWQMGYGIDNTTITAEYTYIEVAWGNASNKHTIFKEMHGGSTSETCGLVATTQIASCAAYHPVPAGANIYIRGRCSNAPDTNYHANVLGIGG